MLCYVTDFGVTGPYVGQMRAAVSARAPALPQIDLMHDAPAFAPRPAAYLLAALAAEMPAGATFCVVVDPGVGGPRRALMLEAGGRRFVGPDNGVLAIAARRDPAARWHELTWRPERLSASFHGRDLFAPAAARWAVDEMPAHRPVEETPVGADWPEDLAEVIYIDRYGNCMTGLRGDRANLPFARCRTFSEAGVGEVFWYANSNGLAEIAVNQGSAADTLGLRVGSPIAM
ncbi:SAM-dependent chlorinase/fluorinase [Marivibrio halodurans]|uniref:SAM-dependent chlorinase/fluorinase n=1 Tax=Marivibrio halodurans TaxID=2039722 RepID=A0A8J7SQ16_9PROT|nr:SAM-dependent chlorinase/fluorinase [Marivibrio halodurans]MBP5858741.1 SAM-dependent chlorinase/fluorinase [Marivibrio halodurans]